MRAQVILVLRAMAAAPLAGLAVILHGLNLGANHLARMILGNVTHVPMSEYVSIVERLEEMSERYEKLYAAHQSAKADAKSKRVRK